MIRWVNGAWNDYDSFKDSSIVIPGAGFMIVAENQGKSTALSKPKLIRPDKMLYTGIALNQGWNLVGNPFLVDVPFDDLIFQGGTSSLITISPAPVPKGVGKDRVPMSILCEAGRDGPFKWTAPAP